jgi:hypothetical protein
MITIMVRIKKGAYVPYLQQFYLARDNPMNNMGLIRRLLSAGISSRRIVQILKLLEYGLMH